MEIKVNGESREIDGETTLAALLEALGIENRHLAIEHNGEFVDESAELGEVVVKPGDSLEIVRFVGGG